MTKALTWIFVVTIQLVAAAFAFGLLARLLSYPFMLGWALLG